MNPRWQWWTMPQEAPIPATAPGQSRELLYLLFGIDQATGVILNIAFYTDIFRLDLGESEKDALVATHTSVAYERLLDA